MAMGAAWKLRRVLENVRQVLAIELMCAAQAVEYRAPLRPAPAVARALDVVRRHVAPLVKDRVLSGDMTTLAAEIAAGDFDPIVPNPVS
jgi:histidine ammonia-lyase